jgi:hypothetical protein
MLETLLCSVVFEMFGILLMVTIFVLALALALVLMLAIKM